MGGNLMTFDQFVRMALMYIDENAYVYEDSQGYLCISTNWQSVGDEDAPLGYEERDW
jgi:hypothetical protein